jgi:hypothetical protein
MVFVEKRILFFDHSGLNTALYSLKFSPEFVLSEHFLRILGGQRQNCVSGLIRVIVPNPN